MIFLQPLERTAIWLSQKLFAGLILIAITGCNPSPDDGRLTNIPAPSGNGASLPRLTTAIDGAAWLSWVEPLEAQHTYALFFSVLGKSGWGAPKRVVSGDSWFINWADFPSVVPMGDERIAAHWLSKKPGGVYAYDVAMTISADGGRTWADPLTPHTDGTATEHGFVTLFPLGEDIGAVWLDGRNMTAAARPTENGDHAHGGMTLRYGRLNLDGKLVEEALLDELTCDCCQTGVTVANSTPIVVYRDRTESEIRDIYVTAYRDGAWSTPYAVADDQWEIAACPVNGPAVDSHGDQVAATWFTAAGDSPSVKVAFSFDGARSFGPAIEVDAGRVLGRVDLVMRGDGSAIVSWFAMADGELADLRYRTVTSRGELGPVRIVTRVSGARPTGFPQMTAAVDRLIFAWT
ncbi:MAG: hypothetical protein ACR2QU_07415, partial [Gammaproteobacteria bacterium]